MQAILALLFALLPLGGASPDRRRGDPPSADHPVGLRPEGSVYPGGVFGQAETTVVSVENFRFCTRVCRADSVAYLRTLAGPVPGSDNPRAVVYMQPGAELTWTYRDTACDLLGCTGHDIRIEDGTGDGRRIGLVTAETGHESLDWTIPADAEPESIIRYFCARHGSVGMTGAFQVLPIRVLSVSYPTEHRPSR
jgi:plastocyanin